MKLSKKSKSFYSMFKYISIIFCCAMFFYLMIDVWDKFNNQMTSMGVRFQGGNMDEKPLPCLTACPWAVYRERGFYFNKNEFIKQTFEREEIFFNISFINLFDISVFQIEEIYTIFQGRCYMVCHSKPLPRMIPFTIFFQKYMDLKGIMSQTFIFKIH
jgi:hypothetical protein